MKVAICFSGETDRYFQYADIFMKQMPFYKGLTDCDFYFSQWKSPNDDQLEEFLKETLPKCIPDDMNVNVYTEFTDPYVWSSRYSQQHCWSQGNNPRSMFSMFGGFKNVDLFRQQVEKENNIQYDYVIKTRSDIHLIGENNFQKYFRCLEQDKIVILPKNWHWFDHWTEHGMLQPAWYIAKPDYMSEISKLVDNIDSYVDAGCRFHPESLFWWHLKNTLIPPQEYRSRVPNGSAFYGFVNVEVILRGANGW